MTAVLRDFHGAVSFLTRFLACIAFAGIMLPRAGFAEQVPITIFHTTDIHSYFRPSTDYEGNENVGGMLKLVSLLKERRDIVGEHLLVDCGDTIQGAPEGILSGGVLPVEALNFLNYDAWVLGNHELDWGWQALKKALDHARIPVLAANMLSLPDTIHPLPSIKPYIIRDIKGVRVAVIGLNTPGIPYWTLPDYLGSLIIEDSIKTLRTVMPRVKAETPDIILLAMHQGHRPYTDDFANQVGAITKSFPEIDVVLGGHTHRVCEERDVNGALYCQAGYHANWFGELTLGVDIESREIVSRDSTIHHVGSEPDYEPEFHEHFKESLDRIAVQLDQVIGSTETEITSSYDLPGCSPMQQLLSMAIAEASGAELVLHGVLTDYDLPPGDIRMGDVWKFVPYENRIGIAHLTASEIEEILTENLQHKGSYGWMGVYGMNYNLYKHGEHYRVDDLRYEDGSWPHGRRRIPVAMNSYVLASGGQKFLRLRSLVSKPEARLEILDIQTREAVIEFIKDRSPLNIAAGTQIQILAVPEEGAE